MPNRGGFSWKRLSGYSAAKSRISRRTGIPLTRSGRQRKVGRMVTGGGCLLPLLLILLLIATIACSSAGTTPGPTRTPRPTATRAPTRTPRPTVTRASIATAQPTNTLAPTLAPTQAAIAGAMANTGANLRTGPGTTYPKTGSVSTGQQLDIIARNPAGDWYQLASGAWIFANLVDAAPVNLPIASNIPAPPVSVPAAAIPTARGLPSAAGSTCPCDQGNTLNCDDFDAWDAQACYLRCKEQTGRDVHGLDRDNDGSACEWKY